MKAYLIKAFFNICLLNEVKIIRKGFNFFYFAENF